ASSGCKRARERRPGDVCLRRNRRAPQAVPGGGGQLQYVQDAFSAIPRGASGAAASVKLTEDTGYTTVVPPSRYLQKEHARLITVCYAGTGQTGCGWGRFKTPAGTWSQHTGVMPYIDDTPRRAEPASPGRSPVANGVSSATPGCAGSGPSS